MKNIRLIVSTCILCIPLQSLSSDYGTTGLIDIPSARMQTDATFSTAIVRDGRTESYALTYQVLPWLEGTFRYTGFDEFFYWDRNYEVKARLFEETALLPQISVGIRDLVGTGVFGSEYIVASKQYENFDFTLGMGWGRLAGDGDVSNPLTILSDRFEQRTNDVGRGGTLSTDTFFSGSEVGIFGGITYDFTFVPIKAILEYNPDELYWERARGGTAPKSPWSVGLSWSITPDVALNLNYQHGDTVGFSIHSRINTNAKPSSYKAKPFRSSKDTLQQELPPGIDKSRWYPSMLYDVEKSDLFMLAARVKTEENLAVIEIQNESYPNWQDAIYKTHQIAQVHVPPHVNTVEYIVSEQGHKLHSIRLPLQHADNVENLTLDPFKPKLLTQPTNKTGFVKDTLILDATLQTRFMLFDPQNPLAYQLYLNLGTKINLPDEWAVKANYRFDVHNNFTDLDRRSDSILPHVRSDALRYLKEGESGLESLYVEKRSTFEAYPELHYRAYAGVVETMFSAVGGEILYQPYQSRLAFGVSGAYAKQRAYDGGFGHLDYTALTGHVSLYWATPFKNYDAAIHVGQYLAKDKGATFEVRRTFNNGWQLGLWATLTDVPFDDFGEGSFDKGMFFRIPFDNFFSNAKKSVYKTRIRPIQRDGGARLEGFSGDIWWDIRDARYDVFGKGN